MSSFLAAFAALLIRRRTAVIVAVLAVAVLFASFLPRLRADFSPSELFARVEGQQEILDRFQTTFGNTDNVVLVLVEAPNVYERAVLEDLDLLSGRIEALPDVARVDSLARLPIPRRVLEAEPSTAPEETLIGLLYRAMQPVSVQLGGVAARLGLPAPEPPPAELPETIVSLARGEVTQWGPVARDGRVSAQDAELLLARTRGNVLVQGKLVTPEGDLAALAVELAAGVTRNEDVQRAARAIDSAVRDLEPLLHRDVSVRLGGLPWLRTALIERMKSDQSVLLPSAIGVCILILLLAFRWWPAMWMPTVAVVLSALILVGGMALVGEPFNILNNIIPLVIIVIGISDAIHLINRFLEEVPRAGHVLEAARRTVVSMASACFLTSFTTAVGFASLVVSETSALRHFGLTAAAGVLLAYLITILFLPASLGSLRGRIPGAHGTGDARIEAWLDALTRAVIRHRVFALLGGAALLAATVALGLTVRVDNAVLDQFDPEDEVYQTTRLIEDRLTGVRPVEIYLRAETPDRLLAPDVLDAMRAVQRWALDQPGILGSQGPVDTLEMIAEQSPMGTDALQQPDALASILEALRAAPRNPLARWINDDGTEARVLVQLPDFGARRTLSFGRELEAQLALHMGPLPDVDAVLTGDAWVSSLGLNVVITDLAGSLGAALVIIFFFLLILFRSPRSAFASLPPNLLPLGFVLGFMALGDVPLNAATVIIFSVSIGLAVDGAIHVIARFREELEGSTSVEAALVRSMRGTGKAILLTNLALMIGFGVMLTSSFVPVRLFGTLICVTVIGCTFATLLILPALLRVLWGETHEPTLPR